MQIREKSNTPRDSKILVPQKPPSRDALNILPEKNKELQEAEENWWKNVYAYAPESVKQALVPKLRRVGKESHLEKPGLIVQTPCKRDMTYTICGIMHAMCVCCSIVSTADVVRVDGTVKDTPTEVLAKLEKLTGLLPSHYRLYHGSRELVPSASLQSQGFSKDDRLLMRKVPRAIVRLSTGQIGIFQMLSFITYLIPSLNRYSFC